MQSLPFQIKSMRHGFSVPHFLSFQISVYRSVGSNALFLSRQEKSQKKPSKGCCRAQRINNTMVAGGNHTIISATSKSSPLYNPQPQRHPALKNVPIFERLHIANLQICTAEPAENRYIFSGRWSLRREWGPGRGCDLLVMPRPGRLLWLLSCSDTRK